MPISRKEVEYIADLARLDLREEEIGHFQEQLEGILGYIDKLKSVDVSDIAPMAHVLDLKNVFRPDEARKPMDVETVLKHAPQRQGHFFIVPKVIE